MVEKTLKKIGTIEKKADEIIKKARESATLELIKTREKLAQDLMNLETELVKGKERAVLATEKEAAQAAEQILSASQKEVKDLAKKVEPNLAKAKKEILRCLS